MPSTTEVRMPKEFVTKFLKARGYKSLHTLMCNCTFECVEGLDHPIKWLWEHIRVGHEPSFDCCHCWNQKVGGGDYAEVEEWYRWFTFTWSREKNDWVVTDTYQGCEGFEEPSPAWCWRR